MGTRTDSPAGWRSSRARRAGSALRSRAAFSRRARAWPPSTSTPTRPTACSRSQATSPARPTSSRRSRACRRARARGRPRLRGRGPGGFAAHRRGLGRGVAAGARDQRRRRLLLEPRRPPGHGRARLRTDRERRLDRREGGQPDGRRLLGLEGRGHRAHEGGRKGRRPHGRPRQLRRARGDRDTHARRHHRRTTSTTWSSASRWAA